MNSHEHLGPDVVEHRRASPRMFPTDLAIFSPSSSSIPLCIQMRASGAAGRPRLGGLVLVVREDEVDATAVDVEPDAQQASAIAEHSMCQPGRPRPHGVSQEVSSPGFYAFQSAKSSGSSLRRALDPLALVHVVESRRWRGRRSAASDRTRKYTSPPTA